MGDTFGCLRGKSQNCAEFGVLVARSEPDWKIEPYNPGFGPFTPEIYRMPYAYCYRCPYNLAHPGCAVECARSMETVFKRHIEAESVAAVIFEPVLGEGGFVAPPSD